MQLFSQSCLFGIQTIYKVFIEHIFWLNSINSLLRKRDICYQEIFKGAYINHSVTDRCQ